MGKPIISVILSVLNERENLPVVHAALAQLAEQEPGFGWEFLYVDDGSTDGSVEILRALAAQDARVKVIRFTRRFGAHETSAAGLRACSGGAAVLMAADMQDPPSVIRDFIRQWQAGAEVVFGVRAAREDAGWRKWGASLFTWLIRRAALPDFPKRGTGGFCMLSRKVIDAYAGMGPHNHATPAMLVWLGFRRAEVEYQRDRRLKGHSKFGLSRLFKTAFDMILGFSTAPAWWILLAGAVATGASGVAAAAALAGTMSAIVPLLLLLSGVHLVAMGVLGQYLWRILDEVRGRPQYVVQERIGAFSHADDRERRAA